jgi:hypothetical protein
VSFGAAAGGGGSSGWGGGGVFPGAGATSLQNHPPPMQYQGPPTYYNGHGGPPSTNVFEDPSGKPGMLEVVAGLSRDCFIIPLACVDRFLPAGLTVSFLFLSFFLSLSVQINHSATHHPIIFSC